MTKTKKTLKDNQQNPEGKSNKPSSNKALTAEEVSEKYTVKELKEILRENNLKVSGKKQELVERVLPILNDDSNNTTDEDVSNNQELTEEEDNESKEVNDETLISSLNTFGINYDNLTIKHDIVKVETTNIDIQGTTQNGLCMSDSAMSIITDSESSNVNLKMNLPEVYYSNFENTTFTLNNLDLSILPSSNPKSLELSALVDNLELITDKHYVNLDNLNLFSKALPDKNAMLLDVDISKLIYPNFNGTSFNFENLDFNLAIGLDGENLNISVKLPKLNLISKKYKVDLSDLNLNIVVPDLELSNLGLSILMSDFHYTNYDDVNIDMDNVDVSLEPILNSNQFDVLINMDNINATGVTFDEMFPMLNIEDTDFENLTSDSKTPINLIGCISPLDIYRMDLSSIVSLMNSGFDVDSYTRSLPNNESTITVNSEDAINPDDSGFDLSSIFENFDYSSLNSIVLNLSGLIDAIGIDLGQLGIDLSDYDLSAISISDIIDVISNSDFDMSPINSMLKLFSFDEDNLELSGVISSFDSEKFDISTLLESLNISVDDISSIINVFNNSDLDLGKIFENFDYSSLDAIVLDLTGVIDSISIDLTQIGTALYELGIDLSDYDLSAIRLSEIMDIVSNIDFDMDSLTILLKSFGIDLDEIDLSGLIASFDSENFDLTSLLASLNISTEDISGIMDIFNDSDLDLAKIFEDFNWSCLDAIELDLTGLIDSIGINLTELGIDLSDYDLSSIKISDLVGIFSNFDFDMNSLSSMLKLAGLDVEKLDLSGLIASFDSENFDLSTLLASLNLPEDGLSDIMEIFNNPDMDLGGIFENCDYSCLNAIELDLTGLIDSTGMDLGELGIDLSDYDLSSIGLSDVIDIINKSDYDMSEWDLSSVDFDELDLSGLIANIDSENFDPSTLLASLNLPAEDIPGIIELLNNPELDLGGIFENCDYSCLDAIKLNLTGLIDSTGIDLSTLDMDLSDYDLSSISLSDIVGIISNLDLDMNTISSMLKLIGLDVEKLDLSGLISSFDTENFDLSTLLASLNISTDDISGILNILTNPDFKLGKTFENCDYSCLDAIKLNLTGLIDSTGIDLTELGIDLSDYDLSSISLSDLINIINNLDIDMDLLTSLLKSFGINLDEIDLSGLIASFDSENFDLSALLASLNLPVEDISSIIDIFTNPELDLGKIFENCDYSCLDAIKLDLSGIVDSNDLDLSSLGIDLSEYDLSSISLSEVIDIINNSEFIKSASSTMIKLFSLDFDDFDWSGLVVSYDLDELDISALLTSLNIPGVDISATLETFNSNGLDLVELINQMLRMFLEKPALEAPSADEAE